VLGAVRGRARQPRRAARDLVPDDGGVPLRAAPLRALVPFTPAGGRGGAAPVAGGARAVRGVPVLGRAPRPLVLGAWWARVVADASADDARASAGEGDAGARARPLRGDPAQELRARALGLVSGVSLLARARVARGARALPALARERPRRVRSPRAARVA